MNTSCKTTATAIAILLYSQAAISQPTGYKDRLALVRDLVNSNELIMIWSQGANPSNHVAQGRIFDLDLTHPGGVDSTLVRKPLQIDSVVAGNRRMDIATGNFLGDKYKHPVAAWPGPGNTVTVTIPHVDAGTLSWTDASRLSIPGLASAGKRKIHVETGDFFGNRQDEFVLAYHGADTTIHLQVFSFNPGSLDPQMRGSIHDEHLMLPGTNLDNWDIVTGDFDCDGYHDIALLFVKPLGGLNWALYSKIYSVDSIGNIVPKASQEVFPRPAYTITDVNVVGASGSLDGDSEQELLFAFNFYHQEPDPDTYVYLLDIRNNLNTIVANDAARITGNHVSNSMEPLEVAAGDLNNDGRDEAVYMSGSNLYVHSVDDQLVPQFRSQRSVPTPGDNNNSDEFLVMEDMDLDRRSEIVVAKSFYDTDPGGTQHFELLVFGIDSALTTYTVKARRLNEVPILTSMGIRNFAIALGDFDGDRKRLGTPVHHRRTGVLQPTVIVYTPPIHYDILDSTIFDLSGCYPGQSCGFSSSYIQSSSFDTTVNVETHEDWGGDLQITAAAFVLQGRVKSSYGEKFAKREGSSHSMTVSTGRIAAGDDWLYANVYDIDFYEYPVYDSADAILGHFIVSVPGTPRPLWIEYKDENVLGNLFRADHEVGNILSYRLTDAADTSRVIVRFPEQTVGSTGNSFVSLQISSFRENGIDSSKEGGIEIGATIDAMGDFSGFSAGTEVQVNAHYNIEQVKTQTVKVGNSLEVRGDLGHLQPQFGTSGTYYVKPYAYWTSYGALVLDYKISPLSGGGNSFWQAHYGGKPDLAFALPWRYDPEKGFPLPGNDQSYRYRSRDVALSRTEPRAGDTVRVGARVRNLGLQAVTPPITVRFYYGNPATTGILIAESVIDTVIAPRSSRNVFASWTIPLAESLMNARIYAVIDPDNAITNEVHENNNMGWAPVIGLGGTTAVGPEGELPQEFVLYQSYPNPFNPMTTIRFDLPSSAHVLLKVYNVLGQEVVTLANEIRNAGSHHIHFNGAGMASGVYFYRLQAKGFVETKKFVLLR